MFEYGIDAKRDKWVDRVFILLTVCLTIAFWGGYLNQTFQSDTYNNYFNLPATVDEVLRSGRYLQWIYFKISLLLGSNPPQHQFFHVSLAFLVNIGMIVFIYRELLSRLTKEKPITGLAYCIICVSILCIRMNVFFSDILQFGDAAFISFLGDFFAVLSASLISRKGPEKKKNWILAVLLFVCSAICVQSCVFFFVGYSMLLFAIDCMQDHATYHLLRELGKRISVYFCGMVIVLFNFSVVIQQPLGGRGDLTAIDFNKTAAAIVNNLDSLLADTQGVLPRHFYTVLCVVVIVVLILLLTVLCAPEVRTRSQIKIGAAVALALVGMFMAVFVVALVETWLPHRVIVGYMTLLPAAVILGTAFIHIFGLRYSAQKLASILLAVVIGAYFVMNWIWTSKIYMGQIITNAVEQADVRFYYSEIVDYEQDTGIEITKIAVIHDASFRYFMPNVVTNKSINARAFSATWAYAPIFQYVTGRSFQLIDMPEEIYQTYFEGKNWDVVSEEQIYCDGDAAYICVY